jgi:hypothetical protein
MARTKSRDAPPQLMRPPGSIFASMDIVAAGVVAIMILGRRAGYRTG